MTFAPASVASVPVPSPEPSSTTMISYGIIVLSLSRTTRTLSIVSTLLSTLVERRDHDRNHTLRTTQIIDCPKNRLVSGSSEREIGTKYLSNSSICLLTASEFGKRCDMRELVNHPNAPIGLK